MKKMNNKGFSLVELIVVIAIMAVLVGVLAPQFIKYVENSRRATDVSTADSIRSSILADIADQKSNFTGSANGLKVKQDVTGSYVPSAIAESPAIKASDHAGDAFQASWNASEGTCDVWDSTGTFLLTDPVGGQAYKNQDSAAPSGQKATVNS